MGYTPDYIIGHSTGEIACAYADNCLTENQCIHISYIRSKMVELLRPDTYLYNFNTKLPNIDELTYITTGNIWVYQVKKTDSLEFEREYPYFVKKLDTHGKMIFASITEDELIPVLTKYPDVVIACHNSRDGLTLSGPVTDINIVEQLLIDSGKFVKPVETDGIAYHSLLMLPYSDYLYNAFKSIILIPVAKSSKWLSSSNSQNSHSCAKYHTDNVVGAVYFYQQIEKIPGDVNCVFVEI